MSTNLSGNTLTLNNTSLNEETLKAIRSYCYVPDNCKAGDTVILDGIECLCIATGVTIQGSNLTRIAVDKNHSLGYYQKYIGLTLDGTKITEINYFRWGGYGTAIGNTSQEVGYGLQNTNNCLANPASFTTGSNTNENTYPLMWTGVSDFRSSHSDKWFVPSINELKNYVYPYKSSLTLDDNIYKYYSSSEQPDYTAYRAYYLDFSDGSKMQYLKYVSRHVRLCRAF